MNPRMIVFGALVLATLPCRGRTPTRNEPTHFRKAHRLLIDASAGRTLVVTLRAIPASIGYPDGLTYRLFGPDGGSIARGSLPRDTAKTIAVTPKTDGLLALEADPGMNAFSVDVDGAVVAADISETHVLNVINHARPLYFRVPSGMTDLRFVFQGEAAHVTLRRPDGAVALDRDLPQYQSVTTHTPVGAGQQGWWRMDLRLSEDQGIRFPEGVLPFIAEAPLPEKFLREVSTGGQWINFDFQPTPRAQLSANGPGDVRERLGTKDGLELGFSRDGRLVGVNVDGTELADGPRPPLLGFFVRDVSAGSDMLVPRGKPVGIANGISVDAVVPGADLSLKAVYRAGVDSLSVDVVVSNRTASDRAVTVYFALPFPSGAVKWWDSIDAVRSAASNLTYGAFRRDSAGANGRHSIYPFGCVTGTQGLAMAIPMDHPLHHRLAACPGSRQFFLAVDLGLTRATARFPNQAAYRFVIYRSSPRWGLRSAAARYYRLFPGFFKKRMPDDGGWICWGTCDGMTNLNELGFKYHWGPGGPAAVAFDDAHDLYSFLYNDSMRYFADLGKFDRRPTREQAVAAMRRLLDAPDPRAHILAARKNATGRNRYLGREKRMGRAGAENWLRDSIAAVRKSAGIDAHGDIQIGYISNRKDWGGADWWTGRCFCNIDPDIPGGYGRFLYERVLDPTFEEYRKQGAELDGVGLDNYFVNARSLDFSKAHMAFTDYPVSFAAADYRPVIVGDTIMYEWTRELKRRLETRGKWLMANTCRQAFPFAQHLLDMNGIEWGLRTEAVIARTLAYHKQVLSLPVKPEHYEEPFIKEHLVMGVFPGGYGGDKNLRPETPAARLYATYVPIIKRMAAAGWEPIPWAVADAPGVSIERFGSRPPLLFSICNRAAAGRFRITIERTPLHAGSAHSVRDLVSRANLETDAQGDEFSFAVSLDAGDVTVVELR